MRWVNVLILAALVLNAFPRDAVACSQYWGTRPGSSPNDWGIDERFERLSQDIIRPIIRGVAEDTKRHRVLVSACQRSEYSCDLLEANITATGARIATYFKKDDRFGYLWPSVSGDGQFATAVKVDRRKRPSDRDATFDLVRFDFNSGVETTLASAGDGRFESTAIAIGDAIIVVRSYRTSADVKCRGDHCTDEAEVLVWRDGQSIRLPLKSSVRGFEIVPLKSREVYLVRSSSSQLRGEAYSAVLIDFNRKEWISPFLSASVAVDEFLKRYPEATGWAPGNLRNPRVQLRQLPFCATRAEAAWLDQAELSSDSRAIYVVKRKVKGRWSLQIATLENVGEIPWREKSSLYVLLP